MLYTQVLLFQITDQVWIPHLAFPDFFGVKFQLHQVTNTV